MLALSPDELYFDPSVDNYKDGGALFIERSVNINTIKMNDNFKDLVEAYIEKKPEIGDKTLANRMAGFENKKTTGTGTVSLIECFILNSEGGIDQIYIFLFTSKPSDTTRTHTFDSEALTCSTFRRSNPCSTCWSRCFTAPGPWRRGLQPNRTTFSYDL